MTADNTATATTQKILWAVLLASQGIYVGLAFYLRVSETPDPGLEALPLMFAVVALGTAAVAHFFWRRANESDGETFVGAPQPDSAAIAKRHQNLVLTWVLDESIAVYALVLAFMGFPPTTWLLFSGFAFLAMLVHRPR